MYIYYTHTYIYLSLDSHWGMSCALEVAASSSQWHRNSTFCSKQVKLVTTTCVSSC